MFNAYRFPLVQLDNLRQEVERLFDDFGWRGLRLPLRGVRPYPSLNIWDERDALRVEAEVPGLRQEDLEVFALGDKLTVKGRWQPLEGEKQVYQRQERPTGEFSRVITLPIEVDAEKVEAQLKDGVLTLRLPKAESAKPRKIAVRAV